jgi:DUF438 domain-containing protein
MGTSKGHVASHNKSFKMAEIKKLFSDGLKLVTPQRWSRCIDHVIKEENKMMQLDHLIDEVTEMFIRNVTDSDSECNDSK